MSSRTRRAQRRQLCAYSGPMRHDSVVPPWQARVSGIAGSSRMLGARSISSEQCAATVTAICEVVVPQVAASAVRAASRVIADRLVLRVVSLAQFHQIPWVGRELWWKNAEV